MGVTGARAEPMGGFRFRVRIAGLDVAEFSECGGLDYTVRYDEVREGGQNEFVHRLPGRIEYGNLTLKRGYVRGVDFFRWCRTVFNRSTIERKQVTVALVDQQGKEVTSWTFLDAYPTKWTGPSLQAGEGQIAFESIELAHRGMQV